MEDGLTIARHECNVSIHNQWSSRLSNLLYSMRDRHRLLRLRVTLFLHGELSTCRRRRWCRGEATSSRVQQQQSPYAGRGWNNDLLLPILWRYDQLVIYWPGRTAPWIDAHHGLMVNFFFWRLLTKDDSKDSTYSRIIHVWEDLTGSSVPTCPNMLWTRCPLVQTVVIVHG